MLDRDVARGAKFASGLPPQSRHLACEHGEYASRSSLALLTCGSPTNTNQTKNARFFHFVRKRTYFWVMSVKFEAFWPHESLLFWGEEGAGPTTTDRPLSSTLKKEISSQTGEMHLSCCASDCTVSCFTLVPPPGRYSITEWPDVDSSFPLCTQQQRRPVQTRTALSPKLTRRGVQSRLFSPRRRRFVECNHHYYVIHVGLFSLCAEQLSQRHKNFPARDGNLFLHGAFFFPRSCLFNKYIYIYIKSLPAVLPQLLFTAKKEPRPHFSA